MKKIYLLFVYLFIGISSYAVHIVGGDITVRQLSVNGFEFTLRWFKDCNQPNTFSNNLKLGIFDKITNARIDSVTVTLIAVNPMTLGDSCYAPNLCVHEGVYRAQKTLPANPNGYYISYQRCCRNSPTLNIVNPTSAGIVLYAEIPNSTVFNSSPVFGSYPKAYLCSGQQTTINFSATDANNDNLVYSLVTPYSGNNPPANDNSNNPIVPGPYNPITWQSPYSLSNILGGIPNMSINPNTGLITVNPNTIGTFVFAVKVEEYRGGVKIGEIRRDVQIQVINCINPLSPGPTPTITCANPNVGISVNSSTSMSSYNWTGPGIVSGNNTSTPIVNTAGTYTVVAATNSGCTYTTTVSVASGVSYPNVSAGGGFTLSCQTTNGVLNASSTTPGVSYSWSGPGITSGANTATPTVTAAGTYTVTVTNPVNGCSSTATVTVIANAGMPNVSTSSNFTLNCTTTSGTISASSTTPGVTYSWTGPGIVSGNNTATPVINTPGTYTVIVLNPNNNCTSVATVNVTQNIVPPNVSTPSATVITCSQPNSTISVSSSTPGATYSWSGTGIVSGNTTSSPVVNTTGTYTVVVTNPANGCTNSTTVTVTNNILNPNVSTNSSLLLTCTTKSGTISASSSTPGATFSWSGPYIVTNGNTSTPTIGGIGTYTVTVTNPANGCTSTAVITINNNIVNPNVVAGAPLTLTCTTGSGTITASSSTPNASYSWSGPNVIAGGSTSAATVNASGTYTVTVTNPTNGCTSTATVIVSTDNSIPNLTAGSALTLTCLNTTGSISASSTSTGITYSWTGPGIISGSTSSSPTVGTAGTYTVVVTNPTTGCTNLTTVNVINNIVYPILTAGAPQTLNCLITSDTISVTTSTTGVNYNWTGPGIVSGGTTATPVINSPGTYSVIVTNPINGCTATATVTVSQNIATPNLTTGGSATLTCTTTSNTINAYSTTSGVTYSWIGNGIVTGSTTSSPIINNAGTYTVIVTNPVNGCTASSTVTVNSNINLPNVLAGPSLVLTCNVSSSAISANSSTNGALYYWNGPGIVSGTTTSSPIVNTNGTYTVIVTDPANGCTNSATVIVTTAPLPVATAANNATIALGTSTQLIATGGGSYSWSPSAGLSCTTCNNPIASPSVYTEYCVTVTDQYGCMDSACVKINVFDPCPPTIDFPLPNVFSPNGDDKNDLFFIKEWNNECIQEFSIEIFDRWGLKMFESIGSNVHWDGRTASGLECPEGTYYYLVKYKRVRGEIQATKGFLSLVR